MCPQRCIFLSTLLFLLFLPQPKANAYLYNGMNWPEDMRPVPYWLHAHSEDLGFQRTEELVNEAVERWTSVKCSDFDMVYQGTTDIPLQADETNVVTWFEDEWNWGSLVLGITAYAMYDGIPIADIGFNGVDWIWEEGAQSLDVGITGLLYTGKADPAPVITHELGHFIGFSHSTQNGAATMFGGYLPGGAQTTLSADDRLGLCRLYPNGDDECVLDEQCPEGHTCKDYGDVAVCAEPHDDWGDPCGIEYINCFGTCIMAGNGSGYCSRACDNDDDCEPEGWFCYETTLTNGETTGLCAADELPDPESGDIVVFNPEQTLIAETIPDVTEQPDTSAPDGYEVLDLSNDQSPATDAYTPDAGTETQSVADVSPKSKDGSSDGCSSSSTRTRQSWIWLLAILGLAILRR